MQNIIVRLGSVVLGVVFGGLLVISFAVAALPSEAATRCGASRGMVQAEFSLDAAKDLWRAFPAMLRAPELERDDRPAQVVVFTGEFDASGVGIGNPAAQKPEALRLREVVCVVQADGTANIYHDVARDGSRFSP